MWKLLQSSAEQPMHRCAWGGCLLTWLFRECARCATSSSLLRTCWWSVVLLLKEVVFRNLLLMLDFINGEDYRWWNIKNCKLQISGQGNGSTFTCRSCTKPVAFTCLISESVCKKKLKALVMLMPGMLIVWRSWIQTIQNIYWEIILPRMP